MIQTGSYLNIIDNSGAKEAFCIRVPKGYRRRYARIGDVITTSIKSVRSKKLNTKVKQGDVVKALILTTKSVTKGKFNDSIKFFENNVILMTKQKKLVGTRIFGSIPKKLRYTKFLRIASLCSGLIN
jgi:large subunit ribosomal protein L14